MKLEEQAKGSKERLSYLSRLDLHLLSLPRSIAGPLRSQIVTQLDEAARESSSEADLRTFIGRLGEPSEIVAEALTVGNYLRTRTVVKHWSRRVRRRFWIALVAIFVLVGSAGGFAISVAETPPLVSFSGGPWYSWAMKHAKDEQLADISAVVIPMKTGAMQGFWLGLENPTNWTQTVLGAAIGPMAQWPHGLHLGFASSANIDKGGSPSLHQRWRYGVSYTIPPHGTRDFLIGWRMYACQYSPGTSYIMSEVPLRVRVGWFTRIETVQLGETYVFQATRRYSSSASPSCRS